MGHEQSKEGLPPNLKETTVIGPEGHLLGAVFGEEARPIPREFESDRQVAVREVLETLTPRERRVLELRFGLLDGQTRTLEEVGRELAVTRERIRQIETKGLRKLRHPSRSLILGLFIPLHENSLGKQVWNIDLGWQLQEQLSPLDLRKITLEDLGLSQEALYELEEMIDNFSLDTALVRVIRWTPRGLSSLTKDDLKRTTQLLQKVNEVS